MANFTAADVKRLREQTGAGMMDCKNALGEADGDLEAAVELLRLKGAKDVNKRATRTAANGLVVAELDGTWAGVLVELNCETNFVAKTDLFQQTAAAIADAAIGAKAADRLTLLTTAGPPRHHRRAAHRRGQREPEGEARARPVRPARGWLRKVLPAPQRRGPAADPRRARPAGQGERRGRHGPGPADRRDASALHHPRGGPGRRGGEGAPDRRADHPRRGQAGAGYSQDRGRQAERLLQGRGAHRAGVREGPEDRDQAGPGAERRRRYRLRQFQVGQA